MNEITKQLTALLMAISLTLLLGMRDSETESFWQLLSLENGPALLFFTALFWPPCYLIVTITQFLFSSLLKFCKPSEDIRPGY